MRTKTFSALVGLSALLLGSTLMLGSTFALLTSESSVDITISSGNVSVTSRITNLVGYSTDACEAGDTGAVLREDLGAFSGYYHEVQKTAVSNVVEFTNGGTATVSGNSLVLDGISSGDRISFDIAINNTSNIAAKWRTVTSFENEEIASYLFLDQMVIKQDDVAFDIISSDGILVSSATAWTTAGTTEETIHFDFALPLESMGAGNNASAKASFAVQAVQGNAHTSGGAEVEHITDFIIATPSTMQDILDGKVGSISGKTIYMVPGVYDTLQFGRESAFAHTTYALYEGGETYTDVNEFLAIENINTKKCKYTISLEDVSFIGGEGVEVAGINANFQRMRGTATDVIRDHVRNIDISSYTNEFYLVSNVNNIGFKGISFTSECFFLEEVEGSTFNNLVFDDCTFTITSEELADSRPAIRYYSFNGEGGNVNLSNLVVTNCSFHDVFQGIYTGHLIGALIDHCTFTRTIHNAIAFQSGTGEKNTRGNLTVTNNEFSDIHERVIRFGVVGHDAVLTVTDNVATNCGDDDNEIMKGVSFDPSVTFNIGRNNWGPNVTWASGQECLKDTF